MNIYLITQETNNEYDTYGAAVVAAESEDAAKKIHPGGNNADWGHRYSTWCASPEEVTAVLLGVAKDGTAEGVFLAG